MVCLPLYASKLSNSIKPKPMHKPVSQHLSTQLYLFFSFAPFYPHHNNCEKKKKKKISGKIKQEAISNECEMTSEMKKGEI